MSKKHYEKLAWLIGQYIVPLSLTEEGGMDAATRAEGIRLFIAELVIFLLEDNPRFDVGSFSHAILDSLHEFLGDDIIAEIKESLTQGMEADRHDDDGIMKNDL